MKKYFLLFLSFVFSISGYAVQTDNGTGVTQSGSTWYSTIVSKEYDIQDGNNLDVYYSYPSNYVKFDCYRASITGGDDKKKIEVQHQVSGSWSVFYTYLLSDKKKWYTAESGNLSSNATGIAFRRVAGTSERLVKNIYVKMAPHTKMNTSSISFVNVPVGTTQTQTIDFYSFLSGGSGIQAYVVDNSGNKVTVTGLSLSITSIGANVLEKIGENNYSIKVTFNPQSIFSYTGYKVRIVNSGATIGSTIDIPISTLSSALYPPTLKCDENAYDYVRLSWNKIDGATSYKIYDNGSFVTSVTGTSTNLTGLVMGSNHKYTVTSVYASSESNHSNAVNVITNSYPKTSNVWFSNVGQNSFTINWNKIDLLANHNFVRYQVHIYYHDYYDVRCSGATWLRTEYISNQNQTSLTINNVDDATRFVVYVGVDFNYTLSGQTKSYDVSSYTKGGEHAGWVSASVETPTTYNSSAEISNGIYIYKGEWHYINVNIANDLLGVLLGKQWPFYYPQENLKYRAWVSEAGNVTHYVEDNATGQKYKLTGTNYGYTTYDVNNKLQTEVYSINQSLVEVVFTGSRDPFGGQKIYVGDCYSKVARHILMENETINIGDVLLGNNINVPIRFKSFLVDNALTAASDNSDFKPNKTTICGKAPTKAGTFCQTGDRSYDFTVNFTPSKEGEAIAHIVVSDGIRSKTVTITANVYRYNTFFAEGLWTESDKWTFGVPAEKDDVMIAANCTVPDNTVIKVHNVIQNANISITIKPQGVLQINTITQESNTNINIEANELNTGTFLFKNENKVNATVQLYSKAFSSGLKNDVAGNFYDPKWQYIGIITESLNYSILNPDGTTNWIYKWDETQNAVSCWSEKLNVQSSLLYAWKGYCLAQEYARTYTYNGNLLNKDHTYDLTYTKSENSTDDLGNNLITNSYSGPIDITTLRDNNFKNAEATIYIYNTGSYLEWKTQQTNTIGFNPGQTIAIPVNVVSTLGPEYPHTIASSQAFFVAAKNDGATFSVDYEDNVYNPASSSNQKRIISSDNTFNVLKINVKSDTSNDRLYLIEHESCTPNFDNGYDAIKIFDNNGPQIYAINDSMYTAINTSNTLINQYIGFEAASEYEMYTLTFDIDKLHSYNKLYLYDIITDEYVDILNNETYTFYYIPSDNDARFLITTDKKNEDNVVTSTETINSLNEISLNDIIYIYNFNGHLIYNSKVNSLDDFNILTNGIYIIVTKNKIFKLCLQK